MSSGTRVPLRQAESVGAQLVGVLALGCERLALAGSIRRKARDVGDIEIVAIPRVHTERLREGLFEDRDVEIDELQVVIDDLLADGTLMSHPDDPKRGPRYAKLMRAESRIQVDLFTARADTWGMALMIRTGPATFSQWLVSEARRRHFHIINGYELHPGSFTCAAIGCEPIPTPDEDTVWRILHLHPVAPEARV